MLFAIAADDAWLLDRSDGPAFVAPAFVYSDRESGRVVTILGYRTDKLAVTA